MYDIKIYKSKWKSIRLILLSLPFVVICTWDLTHENKISPTWIDWFGLCFFGLGIPFGLFNLLDRRPEMIISTDGIFDRMSYGIFEKKSDKGFIYWNWVKDAYLKVNQMYSPQGLPTSKQKFICLVLDENKAANLKNNKLAIKLGLADYNIPLMNLKKFDEQKFIDFIKAMARTDVSERQKLLLNYGL